MRVSRSYDISIFVRHLKIKSSRPMRCLGTDELFRPEQMSIKYRMSTDNRESVVGTWVPVEARVWGSMVDRPESGHGWGDHVFFLSSPHYRVPRDLARIVREYNPGYKRPA